MTYQLKPNQDWENFKLHRELVAYIYSSFIPLVNNQGWHYLNFTPGLAIFEDAVGNTLYLDYKENIDTGEIVRELILTIENIEISGSEILQESIARIQEEFELERMLVEK